MHHIRHAAAKLFGQLGLHDVARVGGWVVPEPGWDVKYRRSDAGEIPTLFDGDSDIVMKLFEEEAKVRGGGRGQGERGCGGGKDKVRGRKGREDARQEKGDSGRIH